MVAYMYMYVCIQAHAGSQKDVAILISFLLRASLPSALIECLQKTYDCEYKKYIDSTSSSYSIH